MRLCEVLGTVVSTSHHRAFDDQKLLVVQELDGHGARAGRSYLAVDSVQAGVGDRVLVMSEGNGVRQIMKQEIWPIRSLIVGIVDQVQLADGHGWTPEELPPTAGASVHTRSA